jgi:hypothetical protein
MMLDQDDVNFLLLHLLDQQTCDREALVGGVKKQIDKAHAELAAVWDQDDGDDT